MVTTTDSDGSTSLPPDQTIQHGLDVQDLIDANLSMRGDIFEGKTLDPLAVEDLLARHYGHMLDEQAHSARYWSTLQNEVAHHFDRLHRMHGALQRAER